MAIVKMSVVESSSPSLISSKRISKISRSPVSMPLGKRRSKREAGAACFGGGQAGRGGGQDGFGGGQDGSGGGQDGSGGGQGGSGRGCSGGFGG